APRTRRPPEISLNLLERDAVEPYVGHTNSMAVANGGLWGLPFVVSTGREGGTSLEASNARAGPRRVHRLRTGVLRTFVGTVLTVLMFGLYAHPAFALKTRATTSGSSTPVNTSSSSTGTETNTNT